MLLFAGYIDAATPCLSHVVVAVLLLLLVGVKKTMKMTGSLLIVAHRWLIQFAKERQWMTAQMQMHIREVNYMFADERKKVRERYKEYDSCYLGHYAQWFFWFFFTIGIFVIAGCIGMMIAQCYNR